MNQHWNESNQQHYQPDGYYDGSSVRRRHEPRAASDMGWNANEVSDEIGSVGNYDLITS